MKLESRANVKAYLEIINSDYDTLLDLIIEDISERIEHALTRKLKKEERTEYFNVQIHKKYFNLKAYPIDLTEDFTVTQYDVEDTINSDYYVWEDQGVVEYFTERSHCNEPKCMKIVYTGGYEEIYVDGENVLDVPRDLKRACRMQSAYEFRRRRDLGLISITTPDGTASKVSTAELLPEVIATIKSYRNYTSARL